MKALEIETKAGVDGTAVVALAGELDINTSSRVEQELHRVEGTASTIVLDLRGLSFIDSTGLRLVVTADTRARKHGRRFAVVPGSEGVQRVFRVTSLDKRLDFVSDLASLGLE
jgi:anti-anti-sigma factor